MTPKNSAISVQLVQDDVSQVLKQPRPLRVVRQNPRVQHVRVRQHHVPALANRFPRVRRRVAIVCKHSEAIIQPRGQIVEFGKLVLRQRLGREEVKCSRVGRLQHRIQHRQVVAERLARGSRGHDHKILA